MRESPPDTPANCPGDNSAANIIARQSSTGCTDGGYLGFTGVQQAP